MHNFQLIKTLICCKTRTVTFDLKFYILCSIFLFLCTSKSSVPFVTLTLTYVYGVRNFKVICLKVALPLCRCSCPSNKIFVKHCIADVNLPLKKRDAVTCIFTVT